MRYLFTELRYIIPEKFAAKAMNSAFCIGSEQISKSKEFEVCRSFQIDQSEFGCGVEPLLARGGKNTTPQCINILISLY